jgi:hypothetical protein
VCRKNQQRKSVAIHRKQSFNKSNLWDHITRVHKTLSFFTGFWNYKHANSRATNSSFENLLPFAQTPAKIFEPPKKMLLREANLQNRQRSYRIFLLFSPPFRMDKRIYKQQQQSSKLPGAAKTLYHDV